MKHLLFWVVFLQIQLGWSQCITIQPINAAICQNDNVTSAFSVTATGTSLTYQWQIADITGVVWSPLSNNANYSGVSTNTLSVTGLSGTAQTLSYRCVVSENNVVCSTSTAANLLIKPKPVLSFSGSTSICSGLVTNVNLTNSLGNASASFSWSRASVSGVSPNTGSGNTAVIGETLNNTTNTNKTVNYSATTTTDGCGSNPISVSMEVKAKPSISNFTTPFSICSGDNYNSFNAAVGSNIVPSGTTYTWFNPSSTVSGTTAGNALSTFSQGNLSHSQSTNQTANFSVVPTANGCPGNSFTLAIEVKPKAIISNFTTAFSICTGDAFNTFNAAVGSNVVPSGTTYTWINPTSSVSGTTSGTNASNFSQGVLSHALSSNQNINYSITPTSNGCTGNAFTVSIQVKPEALISNFTTAFGICTGDAFNTFNAAVGSNVVPSGTTYTWSNPSSTVSGTTAGNNANNFSQGTLSHSLNTNQNVNFSITPTSNGCIGNAFSVSIQVKPRPSITNKISSLCSAQLATISPTNGNGDLVPSNTLYSWSSPSSSNLNGMSNGTNQSNFTQTLTNTSGANQSITYLVTPSAAGCTGNGFSITLTIFNEPTPNISANTTICQGSSTQLFADGGANYVWTPSTAMNFPYINNPTVSPNSSTTYQVEVIGANGCSTFRNITISVSNSPSIANSPSMTSICSEQSFVFSPTVASGTTYTWSRENNGAYSSSPSSGTGIINQPLYNELNFPTSVNYQIQLTNSNGCTNNINYSVTVHPKPQLTNTINFPTALCSQETFSFSPTFQPSGTFFWSRNTPTNISSTSATSGTSNLNNHSFINNSANDINILYQLTLISSAACTTTQSLPIIIHPNVVINNNQTTNESICSGTIWNYFPSISNNLNNATIQWNLNLATGLLSDGSSQGQGNILTQFENSGNTTLQATAIFTGNANGCSSLPVSVNIAVLPLPNITHTIPNSLCSDNALNATISSNIGNSNTSYTWTFTPQGNVNLNSGSVNGTTPSIAQTWNNPTNTTSAILYSITPTSLQGCEGNTLQGLLSILPKPTLNNLALNPQICSGETFEYMPSWANTSTIYNWTRTLAVGLTSTSANSGTTSINQIITNNNFASAVASFTISAQLQGCTASYPLNLTILPTPSDYNELPITFCPDTDWNIQLNNWNDNQYNIEWSPAALFSNPNSSNTNFIGTSSITATVTATNNLGCSKTQNVDLQILSSPNSDFSLNEETCAGDNLNVTAMNPNYADYTWLDGTTLINSSLSNPAILADSSNSITLTVQDENGCFSSSTQNYIVHPNPTNTIQGGSVFCANSSLVPFSTYQDENLTYHWSIDNGYVAGGQGYSTMYANMATGNGGNIYLTTENEWGCTMEASLSFEFSGEADSTANLLLLGANTLAHPIDSYDLYRWGKTSISSLIETSEAINVQYYNYGSIDVSSYYYWVETTNMEGCVTRSYWNAPIIANDITDSNMDLLSIFPNPVQHTLHLKGENIKDIKIFDMTGNLIEILPKATTINVSTWANGMYILQVTTQQKTNTLKFLKI
jgi:hypothetical protein